MTDSNPRVGDTITTAAGADALAADSVVALAGHGVAFCEQTFPTRSSLWSVPGSTGRKPTGALLRDHAPLTVLFLPGAPQSAPTADTVERAALIHARAFVADVQEVINDDAGDDPEPQWVYDRLIESLAVLDTLAAGEVP